MDRRTFLGGSAAGVAALALGVGEAFAAPHHALSDAHLTVSASGRSARLVPGHCVEAGQGARWHYGRRGDQSPVAVAIDGERLWVSDLGKGVVVGLDAMGRVVQVVSGFGAPRGLAMSPVGLLVCDFSAHEVVVVDINGKRVGVMGAAFWDGGTLNGPVAVAVDSRGHAHVCDAGSRTVQVFNVHTRAWLGAYGHGRWRGIPRDIAITSDGRIHVVDAVGKALHSFDRDGRHQGTTTLSSAPHAAAAVGTSVNLYVKA